MSKPASAPYTPWPLGHVEFALITVTGVSSSAVTKDPEGAFVLLKALSASDDVKSFRVFAKNGILTPAHVGQDSAKFPKWVA